MKMGNVCKKKWQVPEQEPLRKRREWSRKNCVVQMGLGLREGNVPNTQHSELQSVLRLSTKCLMSATLHSRFTLEQGAKAQGGSGCIGLVFL
jgi:hypothetical protein